MRHILVRLVPVCAALSLALAAAPASAQNCNTTPANVSGDWDVVDGTRLCSGTYQVNSLNLRGNRTLFLGGDNDVGQVVIEVATTARVAGAINGNGHGFSGGGGCSVDWLGQPAGGGGNAGGGTAPGPGRGAPSYGSGNGGGAGGGGGAYGHTGGAGGSGSAGSNPGAGGGAFGSQTSQDAVAGAGGGGGSCSRFNVLGFDVGESGAGGGRGGASLILRSKALNLEQDAAIRSNGAVGRNAGGGGGGGGGGAGGTVMLYATEQFAVSGTVAARGGNGGEGGSQRNRHGGGGGAGGGGRVKFFGPTPCAAAAPNVNVQGGQGGAAGGSNAKTGSNGGNGTVHCANIQVPPTATLSAAPASLGMGDTTTLTASATDANGHLLKYEFDCGDGTFSAPSTTATSTCSYPSPGTYTARVRVTDWNSIPLTFGNSLTPAGAHAFGGSVVATTPVTVVNAAPKVELLANPNPASEGDTVTFTVNIQDSAQDMAAGFDVEWDFADGSPVTDNDAQAPVVRTRAFPESGTRTIGVKVRDQHGEVTSATLNLAVNNLPPTVAFGPLPSPVYVGQATTFVATATDTAGDLAAGLTYAFDWGDGTTGTATGAGSASTTKTFTQPGTYTISVTATDRDGGTSAPATAVITVQVHVGPQPPGGFVFVTEPAGAAIDETGSLKITASWSDPNPGDNDVPFNYVWDFGDGSPTESGHTGGFVGCLNGNCTTTTTSHVFAESGTYLVVLSVVDHTGQKGAGSFTVTVRNVPPIGQFNGLPTPLEGQEATFNVSASDLSAGDTAAGFTWVLSWGDGTPDTTLTGGTSQSPTHTFADSGTYTVTLTVTDRDGGTSAPVTIQVVVGNRPPSVTLSAPAEGDEGAELSFTATATDPSAADAEAGLLYEWDFGDGSPKVAGPDLSQTTHTYADQGSYTVTVQVTDQDGGTAQASAVVQVANVAPTVSLPGDLDLRLGESFTLTATATDPGVNDTLTYTWTFGDGQTGTGPTVSHVYPNAGEYTITVTVTDGDGGTASDTVVAKVRNALPVASEVVISPASPRTEDDLTLSWNYSDADGQPESGTTVRWTVDGQPVPQFNDQKLVGAAATARGQVWRATVTPRDGVDFGLPVQSAPVTIGNDAPVVTDVAITPAAPGAADTLTVTYTYADPDGDREDGTLVRWTRNGQPTAAFDGSKTVTPPLVRGDVWQVTVTPRDGADAGEPVASAPVTVVNTPPAITRLEDIAVPATGDETEVSWTIEATDVDGDALQYACELAGQTVATTAEVILSLPVGTHLVTCTVSDGTDVTSDDLTIAVGDVPPVVDAGPDATVDPGRVTVTAVGRDTAGRPLTYQWVVAASPEEVALDTPAQASTTFLALAAGEYVLQVTVSNGEASSTDEVIITVRNVAPVANAGAAIRSGRAGEALMLDGKASTDANGDPLTYQWARVSGPQVTFEGATDAVATLVVPEASGELVVRLTVSDGELSDATTVSIRVAPADGPGTTPPVAHAGPDQTAIVGETVTLDGSASFDVDGDALTFEWSQRAGPPVQFDTPSAASVSFQAAVPGTHEFTLTVSDGSFFATDNVTVEVFDGEGNTRPVAVITPDETVVGLAEEATLDGSQSTDAEGDTLSWSWRQVSGPTATLVGQDTPVLTVSATNVGVVVVELVVSDGRLDSRPVQATVIVSDGNERPVAVARGPAFARLGVAVSLDGSQSYDPEGEPLTFAWTQVGGPAVLLTSSETAEPSFVATVTGTYAFQLVVRDGLFDSLPSEVVVEVTDNLPPTAVIEASLQAWVEEPVYLDGQRSSDPEHAALSFTWSIASGPDGATLTGADTTQPTFVAKAPGRYEVMLVVNDGQFDSAEARHVIEVKALPWLEGGCGCGSGAGLSTLALAGLAALLRRRRRT